MNMSVPWCALAFMGDEVTLDELNKTDFINSTLRDYWIWQILCPWRACIQNLKRK